MRAQHLKEIIYSRNPGDWVDDQLRGHRGAARGGGVEAGVGGASLAYARFAHRVGAACGGITLRCRFARQRAPPTPFSTARGRTPGRGLSCMGLRFAGSCGEGRSLVVAAAGAAAAASAAEAARAAAACRLTSGCRAVAAPAGSGCERTASSRTAASRAGGVGWGCPRRAEPSEGKAPSPPRAPSLCPEKVAAQAGHPHPATGPARRRRPSLPPRTTACRAGTGSRAAGATRRLAAARRRVDGVRPR